MNKLPSSKEKLTLDNKEKIDELNKTYKEMSDYEKTFIAKDYVTKLEEYTKRIEELEKDQKENNGDSDKEKGDNSSSDK